MSNATKPFWRAIQYNLQSLITFSALVVTGDVFLKTSFRAVALEIYDKISLESNKTLYWPNIFQLGHDISWTRIRASNH